ncbi:hypothetical protein NPIL_664261 [Nephila pilipes]|uniref:Uncharacterized protein n=1 Tax=Nephila pilipes TaxID=299642 RepID=A0A8X6TJH7_NEPPI|nr:hypothetical protein NPIL_664261 [Nephila pilipes]
MASETDFLSDQYMQSSQSSSRASIPETDSSNCLKRKYTEQEMKTYTDSLEHIRILIKNLERQGLQNHAIYMNHCNMIEGLNQQLQQLIDKNSSHHIYSHFLTHEGSQSQHLTYQPIP